MSAEYLYIDLRIMHLEKTKGDDFSKVNIESITKNEPVGKNYKVEMTVSFIGSS